MSKPVLVEVSARHVHVSRKDLDILFGEGYELRYTKELSQPGQFACEERVTVTGPKRELKNVIILGPVRPATQVELSLTDARGLGLVPPVRESGDIEGTPGCKITGPAGEVEPSCGVIAAKRHIHLTPKDAEGYNLKDRQTVKVAIDSENRRTVYDDVVVRVNENFRLAMHIDTDEGNAAGVTPGFVGEIID
ncbi:MAG TPA: propanediol utilization protein [Ruminococcaceae bacterium]|nr:propanediol utilization protein [Oscillospiraceae bacterium]